VDRILDLGFSKSVNSILQYLPSTRQTLLFSATLSKSIQELGRLALKDPEYINIYSKSSSDQVGTPTQLLQSYTVVEISEKLKLIYNFVKTHKRQKTLVFFSSCKQVRFAYELFKSLRPGVPVMEIHGKQKQATRTY
jgi:ATP-dependent RNA helicase DDX10/DBP4